MIQYIGLMAVFFIVIIPLGKYFYKVFIEENKKENLTNNLERKLFKLCGISGENMTWKQYGVSLLLTNVVMALIAFLIIVFQNVLPFNGGDAEGLNIVTAFHTIVSFMTNTDLQSYAGETQLTLLTQTMAITFLMFISAASGISASMAFIRGITGRELGNFFKDFTKAILRVLIPLTFIGAIILIVLGVPQSFDGQEVVNTLTGGQQTIYKGPVAIFEAIKQIGTNGGGFFGTNGAHPFENPSVITNFIEMIMMMMVPGAVVICFGHAAKNKKQAFALIAGMTVLLTISVIAIINFENAGTSAINYLPNLEGKETRFGVDGASLFTSITTAFSTGAVNNMHDSLTPLGGLVALGNMMLNVVFGGSGVGFMNVVVYAVMTVFIAGLMVGRTPEYLRKKIESKEIKIVALNILINPLIILIPTALALVIPAVRDTLIAGKSHSISQVLYQFTSAAANNGSGFEGLADGTAFWSISTAFVMFLGRYISIFLLLALADSFRVKQEVPVSSGTFRTDNLTFVGLLVFVILVVGALTFLPALVLGPIVEHLMLL